MSRSAADATRFTATSPHAYSKSTPRSPSNPLQSIPGNPSGKSIPPLNQTPSESPAQKVARLRAAHAAKRASEISSWDRIVVRGRIIAEAAHRITVMGLIGLTFIAGGVAIFSIGDMITHNRRKRKAYYAEQNMLMYQHLMIAKEAAAKGIASEEQILLLNKERAAEEAQEAKKNRKTLWKSAKSVFSTAGLKKVDTASAVDNLVKGTGDGTNMEQPTKQKGVMETIEEKRREGEKRLQDMGIKQGPLDQVAADATSKPRSGGWTSWLR